MKEIMVVDDEPDTLELVKAVLEMNGFKVNVFDTATGALTALNKDRPSLVLLDMRMPEVSGVDFCKKVRATPKLKNLKIVFFTASGNNDVALLKQSGALGYIFKPFDNDDFVRQVKKFI